MQFQILRAIPIPDTLGLFTTSTWEVCQDLTEVSLSLERFCKENNHLVLPDEYEAIALENLESGHTVILNHFELIIIPLKHDA